MVVYTWDCPYCGKEFEAIRTKLFNTSKRGGVGHCGCQTKVRQSQRNAGRTPPNKLDDLTASANKVWQYSTKLGRSITKEDAKALVSADCYYCGAAPGTYREIGGGRWARKSEVPTNGIDRKDSSIGYHIHNCVPCCPTCNYMKSDMHHDDFLELCSKIAVRWVGRSK